MQEEYIEFVHKKENRIKKICNTAVTVILMIVAAAAVFMWLSPYKPLVVMTDSMVPTLPVGSVIFAQKTDVSDLMVGDIITYKRPDFPATITHRIIEKTDKSFITKGDNNDHPDPEIRKEWVKYKVVGY